MARVVGVVKAVTVADALRRVSVAAGCHLLMPSLACRKALKKRVCAKIFGAPRKGIFQPPASYNFAVFASLPLLTLRLLCARFAAFMGVLAVASALFAPVAQLAQDVHMGRLGGVCNASKAFAFAGLAGFSGQTGDAAPEHVHCDLCGAPGIALVPTSLVVIPSYTGHLLAMAAPPSELARFGLGLPNSRGPPSFLI